MLAFKTGYKSSFKTIKQCLTVVSDQHQVPIELLGSKRHIHEYLEWFWGGKVGVKPLLLCGWRETLVSTPLSTISL